MRYFVIYNPHARGGRGAADAHRCLALLSRALPERGIVTTPFVYPSVPRNKGRVRMIAGANLSASTIEYVCGVFADVIPVVREFAVCA